MKDSVPQAAKPITSESHDELANLLTNLGLSFHDVYTIEKKLQSGSFGSVFTCRQKLQSAENNDESELFAVKITPRAKANETSLFREVDVLKTCTYENLNTDRLLLFIDFFTSPTDYHLVTEYCAGGDVYERLSKRVFYTEELARDLAFNLLDAFRSLHSIPIAHRDIKPENLLLKSMTNDTDLKIADFGFAVKVKHGTKLKTKCGTPSFVAPELLFSRGYDHRADLWSIGVTIYILLAGYPPFQGKTSKALFQQIKSANFKFHDKYWHNVSTAAKKLVIGLLTPDPNRRLTSEQALASEWINTERKELSDRSLDSALSEIRKFHALRKLKGAVHGMRWAMSVDFWNSNKGSGFSRTQFAKSASGFYDMKTAKSFRENYELQSKISKGTFATVWKGIDRRTEKLIAVKAVNRANLSQKDDSAVLNEVSILQSLDHPNILRIFEFYEETDFFFIPMELVLGGDVFAAIVRKNQYTEKDARDLAKNLLEATIYLHDDAKVAHRDLKPQNLLITDERYDSEIKIADFGFAKRVHAPNTLRTRLGTPTYVAPEILRQTPYDHRVDLWSIGVILHVLLVGYPPFMDDDRTRLFRIIVKGDFEFFEEDWKEISEEAKDLLRNLLNVDPSIRWSAKHAMQSSWLKADDELLNSRDISKSLIHIKSLAESSNVDVWLTSPKSSLDGESNAWSRTGSAPL